MNNKPLIALILVLLAGAGISYWTWTKMHQAGPDLSAHGHNHDAHAHEMAEPKGPHGGRFLHQDGFDLEVTIFERGVPPQFRVYGFKNGRPVDPSDITLDIELQRLGGQADRFTFKPEADYLLGDLVVEEPHSFLVKINARHQGTGYKWEYESYEGRTQLSPSMLQQSGVEIETVGPREIHTRLNTYGRVAPNEDHLAYVHPRFPGTVQEIRKKLGDPVVQDEVLAVVLARDTLQPFPVKSPITGTIIEKNVTAGELTRPEQTLYTVADLGTVWADLHIYPKDFARVKLGQKAAVKLGEELPVVEGEISYISPFGSENNQTMLARMVLPNPDGFLRPGLFLSARIDLDKTSAPLAVKTGALQTFRDWQVVFIKEGDVFEVRPVELGRRDDQWVEVLGGLAPGQQYAAENSFIIKADILKSGAAHDH